MDDAEAAANLFRDAEPGMPVGTVGHLVNSSCNLLSDKVDNMFSDTRRNGQIPSRPGDVFDNGYDDGRKVIITKTFFF